MNGTKMFSFKGASPLKPVNSTSDSSLIIGHKTGIAITNTVKKRFYGVSNRDASSIIARKTSQNIAKILNDPVQRNTASDTVNKRDVYTALTRVRNKGNIIPAGATSDYSLYIQDLSSFTNTPLYDQKDANGFIRLLGLPLKVKEMIANG